MDDNLTAIRERGGDPKRVRILEGALSVFLAYGYARATMDDIAKAAELSRPALYLLFRNKSDIYRAIAECLLTQCAIEALAALRREGPLLERIDAMMGSLFDMLQAIEATPHGTEMMDMKNSLAGDLVEQWRGGLEKALAEEIEQEARSAGVDLGERQLSARGMAQTFFDALEGMKPRVSDPACHLDAARSNARLLVAALRP